MLIMNPLVEDVRAVRARFSLSTFLASLHDCLKWPVPGGSERAFRVSFIFLWLLALPATLGLYATRIAVGFRFHCVRFARL